MKLTSDTEDPIGLGAVDLDELESHSGGGPFSLDSLATFSHPSSDHGTSVTATGEIPRRLKAAAPVSLLKESGVPPCDGEREPPGEVWGNRGQGEPASPPLWVRDLLLFAALLLMIGTFRSAVADWNQVPTGSMKPSILEGDRIFVNKLAYDLRIPFTDVCLYQWAEPERGDIVVFFSPLDGTRLVKRVVGIPGDKVELKGNTLIINGEAAQYLPTSTALLGKAREERIPMDTLAMEAIGDHVYPVMKRRSTRSPHATFEPIVIPEGHVFTMGDNRDNSADSRVFGVVAQPLIVGKATNVVLSWRPEDWGSLRWDRVFSALP